MFAPARPDAHAFWDAAAAALADGGMPLRVFVPQAAHVEPCRDALRRRLARPGAPWRAPRVVALDDAVERLAPGPAAETVAARALEMAAALGRPSDGGDRAADRLARAMQLAASLDRLDRVAAIGAPGALAAQAAAGGGQSWLPADDGDALAALCALRDALTAPGGPDGSQPSGIARLAAACRHDALVHWLPLSATERAFIDQAGAQGTVRVVALDAAALAGMAPVAAAAWPEAFGLHPGDLRARIAAAARLPGPLVLQARDREDEAQAAAQWICARLAAGRRRVLVVAPDAWIARRLHALLARARVWMADAVGTPLSGSAAAAVIVHWLDLAQADAPQALMCAWVASPFVLADRDKAALFDWIDAAAARGRWLGGWQGLQAAAGLGEDWRAVFAALRPLAEAQRATQPAPRHAAATRAALEQAGAWAALASDPTGRQALDAFERLCEATAGTRAPLTPSEWRALLARAFDRRMQRDAAIDSPVRRVALEAAVAVPCDALVVVGVNRDALPPVSPADAVFTDAVCARIGLPTRAQQAERSLRQFALAVALAPAAALACRDDADAGLQRSPWVDRLLAVCDARAAVAARAFAHAQPARLGATPVRGAGAVGQGLLPGRLSVSDIEHLGSCPYRFWAQALLGLREPREPLDAPQRRELGTFVHAVLLDFHRRLAAQTFEPAAARALLDSVTDLHAERDAAGGGFVPLLAEWRATVPRYVDWLAQRGAQAWRWQDGEVPLDAHFEVGELRVTVRGRIDRVDATLRDGRPVHAVIDYKVGAAGAHRKRAAEPDEFAQLPLYLLLLRQAGLEPVEAGFLSIDRERIELVPLARPVRGRASGAAPPSGPDQVTRRWQVRLQHAFERIERAEPLRALGHSDDCDRCPMHGVCRRQHWWQDPDR